VNDEIHGYLHSDPTHDGIDDCRAREQRSAGVMKLIREIMRGERDDSAILVALLLLAEGIAIAILFALKFIINLF
jgi:hypothetical protein